MALPVFQLLVWLVEIVRESATFWCRSVSTGWPGKVQSCSERCCHFRHNQDEIAFFKQTLFDTSVLSVKITFIVSFMFLHFIWALC